MRAEPGVTAVGRRGLDLDGWGELSVWGWDNQAGSLFAQLWHDRGDDDDTDDDEAPEIWISPPTWEATGQLGLLARRIAVATGEPVTAVLGAMARSVNGQVREALMAEARAFLG
ncbi:MAG TPA: hypothetical protein VFQ44_26335 [Streptosporangiaceae bacterium]|nr:hypothetical protein [Streptosporangiaceae bacterium]